MDNPEIHVILSTRGRTKTKQTRHTTQKTNTISSMDPTKTLRVSPGTWAHSQCFGEVHVARVPGLTLSVLVGSMLLECNMDPTKTLRVSPGTLATWTLPKH
jgi:hypothetical protein